MHSKENLRGSRREQQIDSPDADTLLEQIRKKKENAKASGKNKKNH